MSALGWAVIEGDAIKVRTVSDTRRAAIVNWLLTERRKLIVEGTSDGTIEHYWTENCGDARAVQVAIFERVESYATQRG